MKNKRADVAAASRRAVAGIQSHIDRNQEASDRTERLGVAVQRDMGKPFDGAARDLYLRFVKADPNQPRKTFHKTALAELAQSIKENGLLDPVTVTWSDKDELYYLVDGERRFRAVQMAGLDSIPAFIEPMKYDEHNRLQHQIVVNLQREMIPPVESARALARLMKQNDLSQVQVSTKIGKPRTYVVELLGILRIPEKKLEKAKHLPKQALVEISKAKDAKEQNALLAAALGSKAPQKEAKQQRTRAKAQDVLKTRYSPARYAGARVTVEIPKKLKAKPTAVLRAALKEAGKG